MKLQDRAPRAFPYIFLLILVVIVYGIHIHFRNRTFFSFPDNIDQFYAWYQKISYSINAGNLPIWDANVSSGHSFVGELQAGVFYPINLLWVWIFGSESGIGIKALEWLVALHVWIAAAGAYYLTRSFKLSWVAGIVAGIAYGFGAPLTGRAIAQSAIFFGLCYIPWALGYLQHYFDRRQRRYIALTSLALGIAILSGHIQPWFHACLLLLMLAAFGNNNSWKGTKNIILNMKERFLPLGVSIILSFIIAFPQLYLSAQYLPQAYRFVGDPTPIGPGQKVSISTYTSSYNFDPGDAFSLLNPAKYSVKDTNEIYLGLVSLVVLVTAVLYFRRFMNKASFWKQYNSFLIKSSLVAGVMMLGYWTFIPVVVRYIPLLSQVRQLARYSVVIALVLSVLVGFSVDIILAHRPVILTRARKIRYMLVGIFIMLNGIYMYLVARAGKIDSHFAYELFIAGLLTFALVSVRNNIKLIILLCFSASALIRPVWSMIPIQSRSAEYPPNYYKRTSSITYLEQYYGKARVYIEDGALPVNIGNVYNIQTIGGYGATLHQSYYKFLNESKDSLTFDQRLDLLNAKYFVTKKRLKDMKEVHHDKVRQVYIYERNNSFPRAYYVENGCYRINHSCKDVPISKYKDDEISIITSQDSPGGQLVLSEVSYDGWKAYIDGTEVAIQKYSPTEIPLFRSINITPGAHAIAFKYKPYSVGL